MIRLTHSSLDGTLEWNENRHASELIIEAPTLFREIISELNHPSDGSGTRLSIISGEKEMSIEKNIDSIFNPTLLEFNNRKSTAALLKILVKASLSEDFYLTTNKFKTEIIKYLNEVVDSANFGFEVEADDFSIDKIAKAVNFHIVSDEDDYIELLTDYLEAMTELGKIRLFIFINLRSYITNDEATRLIKNIFDRQINVLFLENQSRPPLDYCSRLHIDPDFCEI